MALAYGDFHELSHQLRFLLFEIGIGLPQRSIEYFIGTAHRECLQRLQTAAGIEGLSQNVIVSHHIHDFLDQLQLQLKFKQPASLFFNWQALRHELDETVANDALAQAYRQCWQLELRKQATGFSNFWSWLCQKNNTQEILHLLEQWGCIGQPYYPNFRAKTGFSRREVLQYSPEFNAQVNLHWCALHQRYTHISEGKNSYRELLAKQFSREYQLWQNQLIFKHYDPQQYYPLPLHPWQWRNQIQNHFTQLIDDKDLILLPHHQIAKPSMSFHTMMPLKNGSCHLKMATSIQAISALQTPSPASIDNGLLLSLWLNRLLERHEYYQQQLFIAADLAGIRNNNNAASATVPKRLSIILQENPLSQLNSEQRLVPLGALFAQSPLSNKPLLIEIIEVSGLAPRDFFRNYCQCLLFGQLHLLLRYGFAFEADQQNTLIAFTNNQPSALVIRNLDNASISMHRFYEQTLKPDFHLDSTIIANSLDGLVNKFVHSNLQSNLAYWITIINSHYHFTEKTLWQLVYTVIQQALAKIAPDIEPSLFDFYQRQLLSKPWQHKALLSMRLHKDSTGYLSSSVINPLSECCK
ncbi:IucA/IucC family protein [Legionella cardiaca]|uniref:IucA/IucC family protein n=1 Tax=Legionella cardiaca TaxID=1071983 RepID=A0ABY8AVE2_9GAMM|nr:IucA/IucC family protein [Legionella cardiaca]WED43137.1 IucA/IucC family protein [Legionella cardiaca]